MKKVLIRFGLASTFVLSLYFMITRSQAEDTNVIVEDESAAQPAAAAADTAEAVPAEKVKEEETPAEETPVKPKSTKPAKRTDRADAFVAGADWEFDGFVAGGQDSNVRSMFYLNDLIYVNIGSQQGVGTGDKIGIYKRGDRLRDPQSGKFIGYEVRRAAIARATDRVEDETAALRITNTYEPVEIGDLVRREQ